MVLNTPPPPLNIYFDPVSNRVKRYCQSCFYGCIYGGTDYHLMISSKSLFVCLSVISVFSTLSIRLFSLSIQFVCLIYLFAYSICLSVFSVCLSFLSVCLSFLSVCPFCLSVWSWDKFEQKRQWKNVFSKQGYFSK